MVPWHKAAYARGKKPSGSHLSLDPKEMRGRTWDSFSPWSWEWREAFQAINWDSTLYWA